VKQADKGLQLSLVSSDVDVGMGSARLGITSPASGSDTGNLGGKHYYKPAAGSTPESWFSCKIGAGTAFRYRYFMKYSPLYLGEQAAFGYNIQYSAAIPSEDVPAGTAIVTGAEVGNGG